MLYQHFPPESGVQTCWFQHSTAQWRVGITERAESFSAVLRIHGGYPAMIQPQRIWSLSPRGFHVWLSGEMSASNSKTGSVIGFAGR